MGTIYLNLHLNQCSDSLQARQFGFISWKKQGFPYLSPHPEWLRVPTVSYATGTKDLFPTVKHILLLNWLTAKKLSAKDFSY